MQTLFLVFALILVYCFMWITKATAVEDEEVDVRTVCGTTVIENVEVDSACPSCPENTTERDVCEKCPDVTPQCADCNNKIWRKTPQLWIQQKTLRDLMGYAIRDRKDHYNRENIKKTTSVSAALARDTLLTVIYEAGKWHPGGFENFLNQDVMSLHISGPLTIHIKTITDDITTASLDESQLLIIYHYK